MEEFMSTNPLNEKNVPGKGFSRRKFLGVSLGAIPALGAAAVVPGLDRIDGQASAAPAEPPRIRTFRTLGRTGWKVSDVSFGAGNLSNANVLQLALDRGMNYIDTGEHYERGGSERTIGEALQGRDRKSVFVTTKLNLTFDRRNDKDGIRNRFQKCLERMRLDYVDCLMIHMCTLAQVKHEPYHEAIRELKAEGKVRFSGLSNHGADLSLYGQLDDPMDQVVLAAAEDGRFDVVLFVYNYLKADIGEKVLAACKAGNMGTTLMKMDPAFYIQEDRNTLGGIEERYRSRGQDVPESILKLKEQAAARAEKTEAFLKSHNLVGLEQARDAAIKFCLAHPDVHCVCPSINSIQALEGFLALSGAPMEARDASILEGAAAVAGDMTCRFACGICEPACPTGVPINTIMRYNYYFKAKGREKTAVAEYAALGGRGAASCAGCSGPCVSACPYGLPVQAKLIAAHETLTLP
jgi:predicted aldo/keto reductase-like oxidoreductase